MATHPTLTIRQDTSLTTTSSPSSTTSSSASTGSKVLYIAVGVALAGVSLIILVIIICCCYRRRHRQRTKPPKTSAAHVLQDHHLPPSTAASGKPTHYAAHAGYSASAEQGHSLLANAAPVPHGLGSSPAAYAGKSYGLQQLQQQQSETSKPPHASQEHSASSTHSQSTHRPPHGPPQQQQQAPAAPPPTAHGPSIPHTHLPVPGQNSPHIPQPTGAAQPRPPSKTGEAATYFDSSVYIGTQRGRRSGGGGGSGEREWSRRSGVAVSLGEVREV